MPRVTYLVLAAGGCAPRDVALTALAAAREGRPLVVVGDPAGARLAAALAGPRGEGDPPGRTRWGTPLAVHAFDGPFRLADGLNLGVREAAGFTDLYVPLRPGDEPAGAAAALAGSARDPGVGAVWCDYAGKDGRVYEEPFDRDRLLAEFRQPPAAAYARHALEAVGLFDPAAEGAEFYDALLRISERFMVTHLPHPLFRLAAWPAADPAAEARAWAVAVGRARARAGNG